MNPSLSRYLSQKLIDRGHRSLVLTAFEEKKRIVQLAPDAQAAYQNEKLAGLLTHARDHVPAWKVHVGKFSSITASNAREVLASLPMMDRSAIQTNGSSYCASGVNGVEDATGGSSGTPMKFKVDHATQVARESSLYWSDSLTGWQYGERIAMLWGSDKDVKSAGQVLRSKLRWLVDNRRWFNAFQMGEKEMAAFHAEMSVFKPHIIVAYSGSLDIYARYLERNGIQPSYPSRGLISSAEMLTPAIREKVEQVFGKPVFNRYGSREFGAVAAEDESGSGLLVNPADFILEIDSPDPHNVPGPLIVTYLHNRAMPFMRYNTGDLACISEDGTRISNLAGRVADTIKTASGKLIHGEFFTHLLYHVKSVREFQFVQETINGYRLLLVADQREEAAVENTLREQILEEIGQEADLRIEYVEAIPVLPSGKRKFTISKVSI